jgi:hypothetical protein
MMPGGCYEAGATLYLKINKCSVGFEVLTVLNMVSVVKNIYELLDGM